MSRYSKAIGAFVGALAGGVATAVAAFEEWAPRIVASGTALSVLLATVATYFAPRNTDKLPPGP